MSLKTTPFGQAIINAASKYVNPLDLCIEETYNRGECIDELKCEYKGITADCTSDAVTDDPYCAELLTTFVKIAEQQLGLPGSAFNSLQTRGAKDLLNRANADGNVEVNTTPAPGCLFYRFSGAASSSGHVGVVVYEDENKIYTIEANNSFYYNDKKYQGIWGWNYLKSEMPKRGFQFMHVENYYNQNQVDLAWEKNSAGVIVGKKGVLSNTNFAGAGFILGGLLILSAAGTAIAKKKKLI